ncbi:hypothetical protein [Nibricoccus sp. IMCC34717]|uniref:hypothetical protein n=1 Tax=Nibricoccus sp. IMCC34717 TaxID=3034021 RepID=UPI00384EABDD
MPTAPDFTDVMAGLTGLRLACWDELATHGSATTEQLSAWLHPRATVAQSFEALGWLLANRLVTLQEDCARWRAVPVAAAQRVYSEFGPLANPAHPAKAAIPAALREPEPQLRIPEPPKVRVHTHQVQFELA